MTGKTNDEHLKNLDKIFRHLEQADLHLKHTKCAFMLLPIKYLDHRMSAEQMLLTQEKVKAILEAPTPTNVCQLRSFSGIITYYASLSQIYQACSIIIKVTTEERGHEQKKDFLGKKA